ncbi:hypothetical protein GCM10028806_28520 [Spirosoma terrae]|uniref:HK97 gp10 family phage protein n=1 Tax=Spirosoma terrae TaxID=1968276 RepID=A0A6L9LFB7_9BACT|nr:hypothetical protein [Spirosoma terrae]NDU97188.1 hypothetical protein [Spirosoma terrae]
MGIKPKSTQKDIRRYFEKKKQAIENLILRTLQYVGEQCVNQARTLNTYRDQTGNLRNSIGYMILHNGQVMHSDFQRTTTGSQPTTVDGKLVGESYAKKLVAEYMDGWVLLVVAGMNYAASVESRGLDVLTSAKQLAERIVPQMLGDLKEDIAKAR